MKLKIVKVQVMKVLLSEQQQKLILKDKSCITQDTSIQPLLEAIKFIILLKKLMLIIIII